MPFISPVPDEINGISPHVHDRATCHHDRVKHIDATDFIKELKEIVKEQKK